MCRLPMCCSDPVGKIERLYALVLFTLWCWTCMVTSCHFRVDNLCVNNCTLDNYYNLCHDIWPPIVCCMHTFPYISAVMHLLALARFRIGSSADHESSPLTFPCGSGYLMVGPRSFSVCKVDNATALLRATWTDSCPQSKHSSHSICLVIAGA